MRNFMAKRMSAGPAGRRSGQRYWHGAAGGSVQHRKQQYRGGGQQFAGRAIVLERRRRQRRFGLYGHHNRLIVGGHVLDY